MSIKKIIALSASIMIMFTSVAFGSNIDTVYDLTKETRLSSGIKHEKIEKLTSQGWMNINVIRVNLNDEHTKIGPLTSEKGVSNRSTLSSMVKSSGAVAGVNGDFFYMGDPTYTYGALIEDGKMITSPLPYSYGYPTISRLLDGNVNISLWNPKISLYGTDGTLFDIIVYNKTSSLDHGPTILTSDWNSMSVGYTQNKNIVEVVVVNNYVTEVRVNQPSTIIPKNGFIIASRNETTMQRLIKSFVPENMISLDIQLDFSLDNIEWAVGGLNYLVKDGQLHNVSNEVIGAHPRTAVGFNKDNSEMILVTVDGRNKNYMSIKQTELANIMTSLGAYNVVNMDGGGSTTMAVDFLKNSNVSVVNVPSDGGERKIASGVGVFDTSPDSDIIDSMKIIPNGNTVFNNTEISLDLTFYNKYHAQILGNKNYVRYEVSPSDAGTMVGNVFKPTKSGKATIIAYLDTVMSSIDINVLDKPVAMTFEKDELALAYGQTYTFKNILGIDKDGYTAYIPSNYINYTYKNNVGKVENGVFTASNIDSTGAVIATYGDAVKNIKVKVGYKINTLNRFEDLSNLKLTLYPTNSSGSMEISKSVVKEGNHSLKLNYDFTKMTDQSIAFIDFENGNGTKLDGKPKAIGMWVYGDSKNHWLRCRVTDSTGKQTKITFADVVDWTGWKWVTAEIPSGISYPITLDNVYLAEINESRKDSGTIYIDNLRIMYEPNAVNLDLKPETEFVDKLKVSKVSNYSEKLIISPNKSQIVDNKGNSINSKKIIYLDAIVTNGSLNPSNKTMWNNIKSIPNFNDKIIVLSMNANINTISDNRELRVIDEILTKACANNKVFVIWKGNEEEELIKNGIRYIQYDDNFELGTTDEKLSYKN